MTKTLFLSLIIALILLTPLSTTSVPLLLMQTAYAYEYQTEDYHDVPADGRWYSTLDANGIEHFSFELTEPREKQYVSVQVFTPRGATLDVYVDGEQVATATEIPPNIVVSLTAGPHEVSVGNSGDEEVYYSIYLGHINLGLSCPILGVDVCAFLGEGLETIANFVIHGILDPVIAFLLAGVLDPLSEDHDDILDSLGNQQNQHVSLGDILLDIDDKLDNPTFGLEEIKNEIIDIETNLEGTKEKVSVTVHLDQINIKKGEVLVLLDTTDSGTLSKVHVAATLPCNGGKPPTAGSSNDTPNVNIVAGEATGTLSGLIDAASDDTGFVGPMKTCVFHDTLTAAGAGHPITDVILINPGNPQEFPSGTVVTITGTYT